MHTVQFTDVELNLFARAMDTLSEQALTLKNKAILQVQEAQRQAAEATPPEKPKKK